MKKLLPVILGCSLLSGCSMFNFDPTPESPFNVENFGSSRMGYYSHTLHLKVIIPSGVEGIILENPHSTKNTVSCSAPEVVDFTLEPGQHKRVPRDADLKCEIVD